MGYLDAMFKRIENANNQFVEDVKEQFGFTEEQAWEILSYYKKNKIAKLDTQGGRIILSHGAFWDKEVMSRVFEQ